MLLAQGLERYPLSHSHPEGWKTGAAAAAQQYGD
jgi:hypothetical protein